MNGKNHSYDHDVKSRFESFLLFKFPKLLKTNFIPDIQDPAEAEPWPPPELFGSALMAAGTEDEDEDEP